MARYALVIGIAEYTSSFTSLETPVQNANAIADILDQYGDFNQVRRIPFRREAGQKDLGRVIRKPLLNETLVRELQQFLQDADGSDVLIYYSGHGFTKFDQLSQTPEGYLAPSDCQIELNAAGQVIAGKNGISLYGLDTLINRYTFNSLVVILDCCNAGAFLESGMVRRDAKTFNYQRDYYLITACRSSSKAYEGDEHSLLTAAVLKGLSPENAAPESGRISGDRLFDVIGNELQNSRQEPIRMGWGRLITLVRYLQQPESSEPAFQAFNPANPYMGLKPFEKEQADYFFGREQSIRALLDRLTDNRFLAVIGPSGCGKSSLVRAGLLPELESDRIPSSSEWQVQIITPGQYPLQALTNALAQHQSDDKPVVLFVDQFEELFTLCPNEEEQRSFIKRLNEETTDPEKQTRVVIAMRGDFLDRCARFQESADLINSTAPTTYVVIPLTEAKLVAELEDSITCPAVLHGVSFESGLVSRIVDDVVNQLGAMPLLQYALAQLWDNCISLDNTSRVLTIQGYRTIGGVKGALQKWADQFYTSVSPDDQAFIRELISELVQIGNGNEVTRRRATWERLRAIASSQEQLNHIIGRLVYQRLLVADDKTVEVAHEALLSESRLIQGWIEENREYIRLQQRLEIYRREWEEHGCSEDYLLDAGRLAAIDEWAEKQQPRLVPIEQEFIERSRERRRQQLNIQVEQEQRLRQVAEARVKAERRRNQTLVFTGVLATTTLGLGLLAQVKQGRIYAEQAISAGELIGKAQQFAETNNELQALIASLEALSKFQEMNRNNEGELRKIQQIIDNSSERNRVRVHESQVYGLDIHPSEGIVVSGGSDGKIKLWNLSEQEILTAEQEHQDGVLVVRFSPDGAFFGSGGYDKVIKIWNPEGKISQSFIHSYSVYDMSFSNNNEYVAAVGKGEDILVWNLEEGSEKAPITLYDEQVKYRETREIYGVDFHPLDSSILASTGFGDYEIAMWDLNQLNSEPRRIGTSDSETLSVRFSNNGEMLASGSSNGIITIRSLNGEVIGRFNSQEEYIYKIEFSDDDKYMISAGLNRAIKVWSVDEALQKWRQSQEEVEFPIKQLTGEGSVSYASFINKPAQATHFSSRSYYIFSSDLDGNVSVWEFKSQVNEAREEEKLSMSSLIESVCALLSDYIAMHPDNSPIITQSCAQIK